MKSSFFFSLQQDSAKCAFVLHGHIMAVKSLSFCSSGLALVSGGIGGLLNIWSLQVRKKDYFCLPLKLVPTSLIIKSICFVW